MWRKSDIDSDTFPIHITDVSALIWLLFTRKRRKRKEEAITFARLHVIVRLEA